MLLAAPVPFQKTNITLALFIRGIDKDAAVFNAIIKSQHLFKIVIKFIIHFLFAKTH